MVCLYSDIKKNEADKTEVKLESVLVSIWGILLRKKMFGDGVNIAARLETLLINYLHIKVSMTWSFQDQNDV